MKTSYKLITGIVFAASSMLAQQQIPCFTDEATKYFFAAHPEEKARYEKEMQEATFSPEYLSQLAKNRGNGQNQVSNTVYTTVDTIPVVFHILHQGGLENVSNSYVYQALAEVNRVHTKTIPDTAQIDPLFKSVSGANNYVFQLATKDPNGNCTNGIIRHYDANTNWDQTQTSNFAYTWDRKKYLNIYIVKNICQGQPCPAASSTGGIIVGYTYLPGSVPAAMDAVVYNYQFMTGTNARSMAHEFGHWLGLSHTFGNTNTPGTCLANGQSDDFIATNSPAVACTGVVDDTPKSAGYFSTCPSSSVNTCDASGHANVQNIMDYSSCPKNFTYGQIQRMHNIMNSTTANRSNVISVANKIATGVRHPQACIPTPYFHASTTLVCAGAPITFSDSSENAKPTSYNWNFPGGTLVSGYTVTDSMPKVTYATPGSYAVSYTASTTAGGASITKSSYITVVSSTASYNTAFTEGFEVAAFPGTDWSVSNTAGAADWAVTTNAAATGLKSVFLDNFSNTAGNASTLISPTFNLAAIGSPTLKFKMSYQQQATTNVDKLQIYSSTDCGATWVSRFARSGTALQPTTVTGQSTSPFIPTSAQFTTYAVTISSIASSTNAMFKFVFYADATAPGNNIYLDDINIYNTTTGIKDIETEIGLEIYPNPSSSNVNIVLGLAEKHNISINVIDMLGRVVETSPSQNYPSGETVITVGNKVTYQSGVYFVNIDVDGQRISKKIIIQ